MHFFHAMRAFSGLLLPLLFSVAALAGCGAAPVRSTVDAYGESAPKAETPLCFLRESAPLQDRPAVDACRDAARDRGLAVAEKETPACAPVRVSPRVVRISQEVTHSPGVTTSVGMYRGWGIGGLGFGSTSGSSREEAARALKVEVFADRNAKEPRHAIVVRSSGREDSTLAVAYEMCAAAFRDYPKNLSGRTYEIKRRETDEGD